MGSVRCARKGEGFELSFVERLRARSRPLILHPAVFISGFVSIGALFAVQDWISARNWGYKVGLWLAIEAWCAQYLMWGMICWLTWLWLGERMQQAGLVWIVTRMVPLGVAGSLLEQLIWVWLFPQLPIGSHNWALWSRLKFQLKADLVYNMVIFWSAFLLIRCVGYYERYREKEHSEQELSVQLANAQLRALRMQLNPHFLFNTLNGISSLMRTDVAAADTMLEQLSCLLRITLERGEAQLIPLSDEMQFVEMYLEMQNRRFAGRLHQEILVDPGLYDTLVPAMILQPIIENAYAHGLSRIESNGLLKIEARRVHKRLRLTVLNSGVGLTRAATRATAGQGVGLVNVQSRLRLHYGIEQRFFIREVAPNRVLVTMTFPLQFAIDQTENLTGLGA